MYALCLRCLRTVSDVRRLAESICHQSVRLREPGVSDTNNQQITLSACYSSNKKKLKKIFIIVTIIIKIIISYSTREEGVRG